MMRSLTRCGTDLVAAVRSKKRLLSLSRPARTSATGLDSLVVDLFPPTLAVLETFRAIPDAHGWLDRLPDLVDRYREQWRLELGAPYEGGSCSWVAPVTRDDGSPAVLKITWPHREGRSEAEGLVRFGGRGAVRCFAYDADDAAYLLERVEPGIKLGDSDHLPAEDRLRIGTALLRELWSAPVPAPGADTLIESLEAIMDFWTDEAEERDQRLDHGYDPGVVALGLDVLRNYATSANRRVLLHGDFNPGNILSSHREPWLTIDVKPMIGDPNVVGGDDQHVGRRRRTATDLMRTHGAIVPATPGLFGRFAGVPRVAALPRHRRPRRRPDPRAARRCSSLRPHGAAASGIPAVAARAITFAASASAGCDRATPSVTPRVGFSAALICSHCAVISSTVSAAASLNTCGLRRIILATRPPATSSMFQASSPGRFSAIRECRTTCSRHVAELVPERVVVLGVDGVERLVHLFDHVLRQALMGLLALPRITARAGQPIDHGHRVEQPGTRWIPGAVHQLQLGDMRLPGQPQTQRTSKIFIAGRTGQPDRRAVRGHRGEQIRDAVAGDGDVRTPAVAGPRPGQLSAAANTSVVRTRSHACAVSNPAGSRGEVTSRTMRPATVPAVSSEPERSLPPTAGRPRRAGVALGQRQVHHRDRCHRPAPCTLHQRTVGDAHGALVHLWRTAG